MTPLGHPKVKYYFLQAKFKYSKLLFLLFNNLLFNSNICLFLIYLIFAYTIFQFSMILKTLFNFLDMSKPTENRNSFDINIFLSFFLKFSITQYFHCQEHKEIHYIYLKFCQMFNNAF